jgi:hypothetical protein
LQELDYEIDLSVVPRTDFRSDGGPNFSAFGPEAYWFGAQKRVLEIPLTIGWCGAFARYGRRLQPLLATQTATLCRLPGIFARLRLFERIRLSPEGTTLVELQRITAAMLARGHRIFSFTYHSPTLAAGNTPYVRDEAELQRFLNVIERYLDYFCGTLGGQASTPAAIRGMLEAADAETRSTQSAAEEAVAGASELLG